MNRISPEQVIEAYRKTGLTPVTEDFYNPDADAACAVGALVIAQEGRPDSIWFNFARYFDKTLGTGYLAGFVDGFDGDEINDGALRVYTINEDEYEKARYKLGHEDGKAVWSVLIAEGLVAA